MKDVIASISAPLFETLASLSILKWSGNNKHA